MRFVVFVEGDTERAVVADFLARWLNPRLSTRAGIKPVQFRGASRFLKEVRKVARLELERRQGHEIIAAVGLLDLYGFPGYPDHVLTAEERYEWARRHVESKVDHPKFRMYFAVHEFEAWLLSQPDIFPAAVRDGLPGGALSPETVDFETPPAKVLARLYVSQARRTYKKRVDGQALFRKLDPDVAYEKCPYLRRMLEDMLAMARAAGL